jgi:hypothetical protein
MPEGVSWPVHLVAGRVRVGGRSRATLRWPRSPWSGSGVGAIGDAGAAMQAREFRSTIPQRTIDRHRELFRDLRGERSTDQQDCRAWCAGPSRDALACSSADDVMIAGSRRRRKEERPYRVRECRMVACSRPSLERSSCI